MNLEESITQGLAEGYAEAKTFGSSRGMGMVFEAHEFAARYSRYVARVRAGDSMDTEPVDPRTFWIRTYS